MENKTNARNGCLAVALVCVDRCAMSGPGHEDNEPIDGSPISAWVKPVQFGKADYAGQTLVTQGRNYLGNSKYTGEELSGPRHEDNEPIHGSPMSAWVKPVQFGKTGYVGQTRETHA